MLPEKTVERLSKYRRFLLSRIDQDIEFIYSHELASALHLTAEQVRRDIMLIGYTGNQRKGYALKNLIEVISKILDGESKINAIIIGMGHLGKAISNYFSFKRSNIEIVAAFDNDATKVDRLISGIKSYHINNLEMILQENDVKIAILTLSSASTQNITDQLVSLGIKGILNFTSVTLKVPDNIFVENYDMITSLEKVAYFVKENLNNENSL